MSSAATAPNQNDASAATSTSTGQKQPGSDQKLSPEIVDLAVAELRYQTGYYLEAVQAMMDGVTLGAEQVQDKRLEFLELGPTTDPSTEILTFVLTLVLEGTVGPAVASLVVRNLLGPIMRSTSKAILSIQKRSAFRRLRLYRDIAERRGTQALLAKGLSSEQRVNLILEAQRLKTASDTLKQDLRGKVGSSKSISEPLNAIISFTENNLVPAVKAFKAVRDLPGSSKPLQTEDSPGVSVLGAAMASASRFRLTIVATHEALEAEIRRPDVKSNEVDAILDDYGLEGQVELGQIRDSVQLATEAMIWALLLIDEGIKAKIRSRSGNVAPGERGVEASSAFFASLSTPLQLADEKYTKYLLVRFGKEVERWALENNARVPGEITSTQIPPRTTGWWETKLKPEERVDLLLQYLSAVSKATPEFKLKE
jgi:hypothetical protein